MARAVTIRISPSQFVGGLARFVFGTISATPSVVADGIGRMATSFSGEDPSKARAWDLISNAVAAIVGKMLQEHRDSLGLDIDRMSKFVSDGATNHVDVEIDESFLANPGQSTTLSNLIPLISDWLQSINVPESDAKNISLRIQGQFSQALASEWRKRPQHYQTALAALSSPFDSASTLSQESLSYRYYLKSIADEAVFDETFSLRQIYLPLRCTWEISHDKSAARNSTDAHYLSEHRHNVGWLRDKVWDWIKSDSKHAVCMIRGGPGSGKSSFTKMMVGELAESDLNCLFLPLHLMSLSATIEESIEDYLIDSGHFSSFSLDDFSKDGAILIFDGLDELQSQGKATQEAAQSFISELLRYIQTKNVEKIRVSAIITGRDVAVQSTETIVRSHGLSLNVAPYAFTDRYIDQINDDENSELIKLDQRDEWWQNYGDLVGVEYKCIPSILRKGELGEITIQPLLNYLVALAIKQGLAVDESTNVNAVYRYLLKAVYDRGWARNDHPALRGLNYQDFLRLLEEVAVCVWHGAGRTTTMREVENHCRAHGLGPLMDTLRAGATSGVSKILLAFYFRQHGSRDDGEKTFEFTHKSFAEYLISSRLVRLMDQVSKRFHENELDRDAGWDILKCLEKWIEVTGNSALDTYIFSFLRREVEAGSSDSIERWHKCLSAALAEAVNNRLPMHKVDSKSHRHASEKERNAEECLYACLNACARANGKLVRINCSSSNSLGESIRRIQGQRVGPAGRLIGRCLSYFDYTGYCFDMFDFYAARY